MNDTAILKHTYQQDRKDWQLVHLEWRSIEISGHAPFCAHCKQFFDWCLGDKLDELYHPQSQNNCRAPHLYLKQLQHTSVMRGDLK